MVKFRMLKVVSKKSVLSSWYRKSHLFYSEIITMKDMKLMKFFFMYFMLFMVKKQYKHLCI